MYKKIIILVILPILAVLLACNIPKTNAYTPVYEEITSQPYVSFTSPYKVNYRFISDYIDQDISDRFSFIDTSNSYTLDSNGNTYMSIVSDNDDKNYDYTLALDDDAGGNGGKFRVDKNIQVVTHADNSAAFVGRLSGVISILDFLDFLDVYYVEYKTENIVTIAFGSTLDITLSIPIDNDDNNTLTRTFNYSYNDNTSIGSDHYFSLRECYGSAYNEMLTLYNSYSIDYLYFSLFISFDITYFEYSGVYYDNILFGEYVVIGDNYEPSVDAYRSVFGGSVVEEVINPDFSSWLVEGVGSFMNFEIIPGWSIAVILSVMIGVPLLIYVLRLFFGG